MNTDAQFSLPLATHLSVCGGDQGPQQVFGVMEFCNIAAFLFILKEGIYFSFVSFTLMFAMA